MKSDFLLKLLFSIDVVRERIRKKRKNSIEDYYEIAAPVDNYTFKTFDGSFITMFRLKGFRSLVNDKSKMTISKRLEEKLQAYFTQVGYGFQIVDVSNPELTKRKLREVMKPSLDELKATGLTADFMHDGYIDFLATKGVWKEQFLVVTTTPEVKLSGNAGKGNADAVLNTVLNEHFSSSSTQQTLLMTPVEKELKSLHDVFVKDVNDQFKSPNSAGFLMEQVRAEKHLFYYKEALYGKTVPDNWKPNFDGIVISEKNGETKDEEESLVLPPLYDQVISEGYSEEDTATKSLPANVGRIGSRFFTTLSVAFPQRNGDKMKSYESLSNSLPRDISYVVSQRAESEPFESSQYKKKKAYAMISGVLPLSENKRIKKSQGKLEELHKERQRLSIWMSMSITIFSDTVDGLLSDKTTVDNRLIAWGGVVTKSVEVDKLQGLMDTVPASNSRTTQVRVLENLGSFLYQSPLFMQARPYNNGYLQFVTDNGTFFSYEEQSSKNINYNAFFPGESGTGKSTLLTLLNYALIAKPKADRRFSGILPVIVTADVGRTSFGGNDTLQMMLPEKKKHLISSHAMTTDVKSAYNIHDLVLGKYSPTDEQTSVIAKFIAIMVCGINEHGGLNNAEMLPMITRLVKELYVYYHPKNEPKMYDQARCPNNLKMQFKKWGVEFDDSKSYFELSEDLMEKSKGKALSAVRFCRRYAVPVLEDYGMLFANNEGLTNKYKGQKLENGVSYYDYFNSRLEDAVVEFPCFNHPTVLNFDNARIISIDLKSVVGEDKRRKALFTSMCFAVYQVRTVSIETDPGLFQDIHPVFRTTLQKMSDSNYAIPSVFNVEEAHMFMEQFDSMLCDMERKNRKEGWGIRKFSQRITDPSDDLLSLCSTIFITSGESDSDENDTLTKNPFKERLKVNDEVQNAIIKGTQDNISKFVARIKTKEQVIAQPLSNFMPPTMLWSTTSSTVDTTFKKKIVTKIGLDKALEKLSLFVPSATISKIVESSDVREFAQEKGYEDAASMLEDIIVNSVVPTDDYLAAIAIL